MARCLGWGAAALVIATFGSPAWAKPGDARDPSSQVKARASARGKRIGPEIAFATVGMGATIALTALVLHTAGQECGGQVEPGAPDSYCQTEKGGLQMAAATLLA